MGATRPEPTLVERVRVTASAGGDLASTLRAIVAEMARDGQRGACIAFINERGELYLAAWDGEVDESVRSLRLPVGKGMMGRVAAEGRPIVLHDLDQGGPVTPANRRVGTNALTRSAIAVPVWYDGAVIGVLEMGGRHVGQFSDADVTLLEGIAGAIADAVRRIEPDKFAAEVLRHRVRELTFLQDTAALLATSLEVDDVASAIVASAGSGLIGRDALLVVVEAGAVRPVARAGGPIPSAIRPRSMRSHPFVTAVVQASSVVAASPPVPPEIAHLLPGAEAVAGVPIRVDRDATAALLVAAGDERGLDPAQVRLLEGVAHLAGLAMTNARSLARQRDAARRDAATGLLTRSEFDRWLGEFPPGLALLAIDVDNLRMTNDACGHEAGDATLRQVAAALAHACPDGAIVARTGGDEFGVLLTNANLEAAAELGEALRRTMHGIAIPHGPARISVGCAAAETSGASDGRQVWDAARLALQRAKKWGRDRVEVALTLPLPTSEPRWDAVLAEVLERKEIRAVFQPIVRLDNLHVVGYEALARPVRAPADLAVGGLFVAAQAAGASRDLDWLCRRAAIRDAAEIAPGVPLFINVGVWTLLDPLHGVDQLLLLLERAGRSPFDVVLEITERELVSDVPRLREVLATYRTHGVRFALDDVGEGHSTLEILAAARPEFVKLAQSLVAGATDVGKRAAIHAVLAFAQASAATVIAEGIESETELALMRSMAVHLGQGFALGWPQDLAAVAAGPEREEGAGLRQRAG